MNNKEFIFIGEKFSLNKQVTNEDIIKFADVTGDKKPLHLDEEYAKKTIFGQRIAHGMISAGIISGAIGMHLPGQGTTYLSQTLTFKKPVMVGEMLTVDLEVSAVDHKSKFDILSILTKCINKAGEVVVDGMAKVIPPKGMVVKES